MMNRVSNIMIHWDVISFLMKILKSEQITVKIWFVVIKINGVMFMLFQWYFTFCSFKSMRIIRHHFQGDTNLWSNFSLSLKLSINSFKVLVGKNKDSHFLKWILCLFFFENHFGMTDFSNSFPSLYTYNFYFKLLFCARRKFWR